MDPRGQAFAHPRAPGSELWLFGVPPGFVDTILVDCKRKSGIENKIIVELWNLIVFEVCFGFLTSLG